MKLLLTILSFLFIGNCFAGNIYISTTGNDVTGNGTIGNPYATLSKAASVASSGDVIRIAYGSYTYSSIITIPVGVSIDGGDSSKTTLIFTYTTTDQNHGGLDLRSTDGTNGNQTISNITLDGSNLTARNGIVVHGRSNVKILYVTVRNFASQGIYINGSSANTKPTTNCTGNEIGWSTINNCADRQYSPRSIGANLVITGYSGLYIHDNIFIQKSRGKDHNGNIVSATNTGWSDGLVYVRNKSYKNIADGNSGDVNGEFSFHMELWDSQGGMEIANNEFHGGVQQIDIAGTTGKIKGSYSFAYSIHDNLFTFDTAMNALETGTIPVAINMEGKSQDYLIYNNHFKNMPFGIMFSLNQIDVGPPTMQRIDIYKNYFENCGFANQDYSFDIMVSPGSSSTTGAKIRDIRILNNTFLSKSRAIFNLTLNVADTAKNITFVNNIGTGVVRYGWLMFNGVGSLVDTFNLKNNIAYNNVNSSAYYFSGGASLPSHFVASGNLIGTNPMLGSDAVPLAGSPAIDAGFNVGLPYSGSAPDIGAFETGAANIPPTVDAGPPITIQLPTNSTTLSGTATPAAGQTITSVAWSKVSGGSYGMIGAGTLTPTVTGLVQGAYNWKLDVLQSDGQTASATTMTNVLKEAIPPASNKLIRKRKTVFINKP